MLLYGFSCFVLSGMDFVCVLLVLCIGFAFLHAFQIRIT